MLRGVGKMVCDCGCVESCEVESMTLKKRGVKVGAGFKGERKVVKNG